MSKASHSFRDTFASRVDSGVDALKRLNQVVYEGRKPPSGAYAFFHHNSHAITALRDCGRILKRLFSGSSLLIKLSNQQDKIMPRGWPAGKPFPKDVRRVMVRSNEATEYMKLDLESLYMFGGVLLDQWALLAIAIGNIPCPKQYPFRELLDFLDENPSTPLAPLWTAVKDDALWLYYQLRFYRNRFIIHANRPWQRGTTRSVYRDDFNLHIPTPPGWLDDDALNAEIRSLMHLAPDRIRNASDGSGEKNPARLIEVLFDLIPKFEKQDRESISRLFGKKGGSTPDFKRLGERLVNFIIIGTEQLIKIAETNFANIELGAPHKTTDEMWENQPRTVAKH